jgi:hypothetical protein
MVSIAARTSGCLFCGNNACRFDSEEHVIPFVLGNSVESGLVENEIVLPPGETCDKCNRRRLSRRDAALAEWPPVSVFRSLAQIPNRRRRLVDAVDGTQWSIDFTSDDRRQFRLHTTASTVPGRADVARALCKIALETCWLEDPADARSARWDHVALAAIGGPLPEDMVMGLALPTDLDSIDLTPDSEVHVDGEPGPLRMLCSARVLGLRLFLLLGTPHPPIPEIMWWESDAATGSLVGPDEMWACFHAVADSATPLPGPPVDPPSRRSSRLPSAQKGMHLVLQPSTRSDR